MTLQVNTQFEIDEDSGYVLYGTRGIELNRKTAQIFHDDDTILDVAHRGV
jgi:hypothetical protein